MWIKYRTKIIYVKNKHLQRWKIHISVVSYDEDAHRSACMTDGSIWTIDAGMLMEVEQSSPKQFMSCMGFPGNAYTSTPVALDSAMFFNLNI